MQDARELRQVEVHKDGAVDGVDDRGREWRAVGVEVGVAAKLAGLIQTDPGDGDAWVELGRRSGGPEAGLLACRTL